MTVFLDIPESSWVASNDLAFAIRDRYPVSPGHTLIITRRVVADWFEATAAEQTSVLELVDTVKRQLDAELAPHGYNVGFNAGVAAGQTVMHLHVHVIPRFDGDMDDPRGGVRHVIPSKGNYLVSPKPDTTNSGSTGARSQFADIPPFTSRSSRGLGPALHAALALAHQADMVSAFVQPSGLDVLQGALEDALRRGARVRILTGDYQQITSADALRQLLRLEGVHATLEARFLLVANFGATFHPKSYIFRSRDSAVAFVGSSNLSKTALVDGEEWNLRVVSDDDPNTLARVTHEFEQLWQHAAARRLTPALIAEYEARAPVPLAPEARPPGPTPHAVQREALAALHQTRTSGNRKGLVVLATGLGKTYLAAFDARAMAAERCLFVAHREEILERAAESFAHVMPERTTGIVGAGRFERDAALVFASVQTLARKRHLEGFRPDHFDYIVIDEFHHAAAATYRKVLSHFSPRFLLGLTATPDRTDGANLLHLCADNLVYRRDLLHGISAKLLVPFRYYGVRDTVDFEPIPWRSGRFDSDELTARVQTQERAAQALREYLAHGSDSPRRTLAFCCSTTHADFMAEYFTAHGHPAAAVHSGPTSAPRAASLDALRAGALEILCAVDIFNEGLDVPDINHILMLRPTQSPIVFLQQMGRGLRRADGKTHLTIVDFIGNHRSFLQKPQALVYLTGHSVPPLEALRRLRNDSLELPEGCAVDIDVTTIDMLEGLAKRSKEDAVLYEYMNFRDAHGRRPSAVELHGLGINFSTIRTNYGDWFRFVAEQGDLAPEEARILEQHGPWLSDLLRTKLTKSYKMIALQAMLAADALFGSMTADENARQSLRLIREHLLLYRELSEDRDRTTAGAAATRKWKEMPLRIWHQGKGLTQPWFKLDGDTFESQLVVADQDRATFEEMTEELIELRLAEHVDKLRGRQPIDTTVAPAVLKVSHSSMRPILRCDRQLRPDLPEGETTVWVDDEEYRFRFVKIAVNVATQPGSADNLLPTLMRRWFGPSAGQPGTHHKVELFQSDRGYVLRPHGQEHAADVTPFPALPFYEDLQVACGAFADSGPAIDDAPLITVEPPVNVDRATHFVVRAAGDSMDGGPRPIKNGDLVLCQWRTGGRAPDIHGKPWLLVGYDDADSSLAAIKIPIRQNSHWLLRSANPDHPDQPLPDLSRIEPVARVIGPVHEYTGPVLWNEYTRDEIAPLFGSTNNPSWRVGHRDIDVRDQPHTVLMVNLVKPNSTKLEHRYADRFLSPSEFQWESQAQTTPTDVKGRRIVDHHQQGRTIHLFVRRESRRPLTYCGTVQYQRHEGEKPMRVWFDLDTPLPEGLWALWQ